MRKRGNWVEVEARAQHEGLRDELVQMDVAEDEAKEPCLIS